MSIAVDLEDLPARVTEYGVLAFLVSVDDEGHAHVVSTQVTCDPGRLLVGAGRRTRANLAARPAVTLLWPPGPDGRYSLIVDGTGHAGPDGDDGPVAVAPRSAVLHVLAGRR